MRKNVMKNELVFKSVTVFFAVLLSVFGLAGADPETGNSESLKDDVTAMITNAKKIPHTIFIIDTSESMNSFAFSDYIDNCKDGISNIKKAIILCENAYKQCRNVEANAACAPDLGCGDVQNKCSRMSEIKLDIESFCADVTKAYKEPGMHETVTPPSADGPNIDFGNKALKYVGPWDPEKEYDNDLCFYDWSKDSDGNVLNSTTTEHWTNPSSPANSGDNFNTDRRDWDCLTDGKGRMYNSDGTLGDQFTTVSGLWMNWKYATSLDAVKIILADTHKFSFPPRFRGQNYCHKTEFQPKNEYYESANDATPKKTCFVDFKTAFPDLTAGEGLGKRNEQLTAIEKAIASLWTEKLITPEADEKKAGVDDEYAFEDTYCSKTNFQDPKDIVMYYNNEHESYPAQNEVSKDAVIAGCDRCMEWNTTTMSFDDVACSSYEYNGDPNTEKGKFGKIDAGFEKICCKSYLCTDPKCRDNDEYCKNDGKTCVLGYYSEYDQDANHCCNEVTCAEDGTIKESCEEYNDSHECVKYCQHCDSGSEMGNDTFEGSTGVKQIIAPPSAGNSYAPQNSNNDGIPFSVYFSQFSLADADENVVSAGQVEDVKVTVYYGCVGDTAAHPTKLFGSASWSSGTAIKECLTSTPMPESCKISGYLKDCDDKGYRAEAMVSIKRDDCRYDQLSVTAELAYEAGGYIEGSLKNKTVLDPDKSFYKIFRYEASNALKKVYEYECRAAFYHRQSLVLDGGNCPTASSAPALINEQYPGSGIEYCDGGSLEREVIDEDMWGTPLKVLCSWQCRDSIVYDDPWKCASFFYMMDDSSHNGSQQGCIDHCRLAMGGTGTTSEAESIYYTQNNTKIEDCCRCLDDIKDKYTYLEKPEGVDMPDPQNPNQTKKYTCAVSGYQFGTASNGRTTTTSGYMAEIIRGSVNEAPGGGSYALQPYTVFKAKDTDYNYVDSPYNGWYHDYSLIVKGEAFVKDSFISAFKTSDIAKRESVCIYDIMKYGWTGEDCNYCGTGCCAIDLSQEGNECDYPQFWMKIPRGNGGEHIYGAGDFSNPAKLNAFRDAVRELQAVGGATLGETLYDVWRYLGGMYALYDPQHTIGNGHQPYTSPFESQDATCFTNEAIVISGGQPEFDHNDGITDKSLNGNASVSVTCPTMDPDSNAKNQPCVAHVNNDSPTKLHPYYQSDWHQTSFINVANFVNANTFWGKPGNCRTDFSKNALGFTDDCVITENNTGNNMAIINHVHTISIGEWGLAPLRSVTNAGTGDFLDSSYLRKAAEHTKGKYYGLTTDDPSSAGDGSGGTFSTLTELFSDMMNKPQVTDVVAGRPHWTSSLVQPFDVEEKYRGPEAYSAGAIPVDGSVSRFWFGNLKKYEIDTKGSKCQIVDDTASGDCGEWKKQTFSETDCFGEGDEGNDFSGDAKSIAQFKKLMTGGAAYRLEQKIKTTACTSLPCYKSSPRTIYYDDGTERDSIGTIPNIKDLKDFDLTQNMLNNNNIPLFFDKFRKHDNGLTADKLNSILDYMAGYDSFNTNVLKRTNVRFTEKTDCNGGSDCKTFKVQDPINIDFNQTESSELTLRPLLLGAIIHSKPVAVYYDSDSKTRIYAGANDGMLHAFNEKGEEVYAYIPSNAAKSILSFGKSNSGIFFNATVDGPITMLHIDQSHDGIINTANAANNIEGERAYLIFGYRRGATGYTVIDISNPDKPEFVQNLNVDGGLSFGKAVVFRKCSSESGVCSYANELDYYLAVPGGYDDCHDPAPGPLTTLDDDNMPTCEHDKLAGNKFIIYKFDKKKGRFIDDSPLVFDESENAASLMSDKSRSWFATSFASVPFVVNTKGKAAVDTEFVYFTDLSGTVFRVDVSNASSGNWSAKVVYSPREDNGTTSLQTINWSLGIPRSYVSANFFPPLERYNPQKNDNAATMLIPIPVVTGNASNPKLVDKDNMVIFYDKKQGDYDSVYDGNYTMNNAGDVPFENMELGNLWKSRGWKVAFGNGGTDGEKGITEPLITYNIYGTQANDEKANAYSIAWNTYIPKKASECKNFGTSSNYERIVNNGKQAFTDESMVGINGEWTASKATENCKLNSPNISIATSVGIIATDKGYDLTFGAGADIFRKREMIVKMNKTYIIKWYELY